MKDKNLTPSSGLKLAVEAASLAGLLMRKSISYPDRLVRLFQEGKARLPAARSTSSWSWGAPSEISKGNSTRNPSGIAPTTNSRAGSMPKFGLSQRTRQAEPRALSHPRRMPHSVGFEDMFSSGVSWTASRAGTSPARAPGKPGRNIVHSYGSGLTIKSWAYVVDACHHRTSRSDAPLHHQQIVDLQANTGSLHRLYHVS